MMTCWQCGAPLPPDVGFCRTCGAFVRPRSVPVNRPGLRTPGAPQKPAGSFPDVAAAPPPSSSVPGFELSPPFSTRSTPSSVGGAAAVSFVPGTAATPSTSWPAAPATAWLSPSSTARPGIASAGVATNSNVGDVFAGVGTGFVLISLLLTWYRVTITPLGVQFLESLERALFSRLFPQAAAGLGGLRGPLTLSLSALDRAAGGWRWAILVVSIVIFLEVLLAASAGTTRQSAPTWPHTAILLVLTVANLLLVVAAFVNLPYGGTPAGYLTVTRGLGAYLGLVAGLIACGGALVVLVKGSQGEEPR